jgi:hypothetical protein
MAALQEPVEVVACVSTLLVLLLNVQEALQQAVGIHVLQSDEAEALGTVDSCHETLVDMNLAAAVSLYYFRLLNS